MEAIQPSFAPVNICYACSDHYTPYLGVSLYSLCVMQTPSGCDVLILHREIQASNRS